VIAATTRTSFLGCGGLGVALYFPRVRPSDLSGAGNKFTRYVELRTISRLIISQVTNATASPQMEQIGTASAPTIIRPPRAPAIALTAHRHQAFRESYARRSLYAG
jgi:hypothetical protein